MRGRWLPFLEDGIVLEGTLSFTSLPELQATDNERMCNYAASTLRFSSASRLVAVAYRR